MTREFVFEDPPTSSCHASTICAVGDELLVAWFGGEREGAEDVGIWLSRRGSRGWSKPTLVASEEGVPCWNPVLHASGGEVLLFYKAGRSPQSWSGLVKRSTDGGHTWSERELLPAGILGPIKNKPLELDDGTLVCPSSVESYKSWTCWVERTSDGGRSWTKHGPIALRHGLIQPAIVRAPDGSLVALMRSRGIGHVVRSTSSDEGLTWAPAAPIDLPQNNSGLDAVNLADGRIALVYNHSTNRRTPLNVAYSSDGGVAWEPGPVLEDEPGEYSYPSVIWTNNALHIVYTWRRERIAYVRL